MHFRVQIYFFSKNNEEAIVDMPKNHTNDNLADVMTKLISNDNFIWCKSCVT